MPENKELKAYKAGMREDKKDKGKKRHKDREIHLIPDLFAVGAVAIPATINRNGWNGNPIQTALQGQPGPAFEEFMGNVLDNKMLIAETLAGSLVAKWFGKKMGLNRVGIKGVKLF